MKNKKGNATGVVLVVAVLLLVAGVFGFGAWYIMANPSSQSGVGGNTIVQDVADATSEGDVAQIKVYVRDLANSDVNTKIAVPIYCEDNEGNMILDGTTSSTSTETSGSTTRGTTVSCYAFNSSIQTAEQASGVEANRKYWNRVVDEEIEHIVIDAYTVNTVAPLMDFYDDTLTVADSGAVNLSVGADGSDSFSKMRFKNNDTDKWIPLGGFYIDVIEATNISNIEMAGSATLSGMDHSSTQIKDSDLTTKVTARKSIFDYVFELDDDASESGNQALLLEENDYLETGAVTVYSDVGCTAGSTGARMVAYAFTKGYFRETKGTGIGYGHENDQSTASVITADLTGSTVYCA